MAAGPCTDLTENTASIIALLFLRTRDGYGAIAY
jgi:hypothetical protein